MGLSIINKWLNINDVSKVGSNFNLKTWEIQTHHQGVSDFYFYENGVKVYFSLMTVSKFTKYQVKICSNFNHIVDI